MKKQLLSTAFLFVVVLGIMLVINSCQKDSDISPLQSEEVVPYSFGCNLLADDVYARIPVAETLHLKVLPTYVNLLVPPVGDQGGEGSCVAWGTTYAGRSTSYQNTYGGAYSFSTNIFSPEYVYNQIKVSSDCGSGAYTTDGLNLLINQGVCVWNDMPYTDIDCDLMPNASQIAAAANYKISSYATVPLTTAAIKDQLAAGKIIVVAGSVTSSFMYLGYDQIITKINGRVYGGHCYACVGYDDTKNAFKFMNSWGTNWATDGFGWVDYSLTAKIWREAYVLYE